LLELPPHPAHRGALVQQGLSGSTWYTGKKRVFHRKKASFMQTACIFDKNSFFMKQYTLLPLLLGLACGAFAQKNHDNTSEKAVKAVINRFFEAMEKGDTSLLLSTCTAEPVFQTYMAEKNGALQVFTQDFRDFVAFIGTPSQNKYKEVIEFDAVHTEKSLASVWTPYKFYLNGKLSHCGTNSFQLVKMGDNWKIQYIIDTRRKGCD
jgi:hypothetical protein